MDVIDKVDYKKTRNIKGKLKGIMLGMYSNMWNVVRYITKYVGMIG